MTVRCVILLIFCLHVTTLHGFQRELSGGVTALADQLAKTSRKTIAVVDFTDLSGRVTELGRFVAEEFSVALFTSGRGLTVIDRNHLKTLLQEHKLSESGIIDPTTAKKLGSIAGADAIVTGTLTPLGDTVRVVIKALDTSTANMLAAATVELAKTRTIEDLLSRDLNREPRANANSASRPATESSRHSAEASPTVFVNSFVRAEFKSLSRSSKSDSVSIALTLENLLREDLYLALHANYNPGFATTLTDDQSTEWRQEEVSGIEVLRNGYSNQLPARASSKAGYTLLSPGSRVSMVVRFGTRSHAASNGKTFSFTSTALRYIPDKDLERFSIGFHNLTSSSR